MTKRWVAALALAAGLCWCTGALAETPKTARVWTYGNLVTMFSPEWGLFVMPGMRYELSRSEGPEKRHYFDELFVGPLYVRKLGAATLKVGLWYYFMGYPIRAKDDYQWSHNVELVPQIDYRWKDFVFTNRVILHNTFYASVYKPPSQKLGFGMVLREMVQATWWATKDVGILAADEPFIGIAEDSAAPDSAIGYWPRGLRLNRIYGGVSWKIDPSLTLTPQYIYETSYDTRGRVQEVGHYLFTTLSWVVRTY
ncbi:MAG: DUF2490 domain-containing protein [Deltaproteobacteria bacterium]|nr:DUF2490 domain-containing protein [Deltaproteobacteria bacterium]